MIEMWTNTEKPLKRNFNKIKPCHKLGYCPYGAMVEAFPLEIKGELSCIVFGHDCPMYYNAEDLSEFGKKRIKAEMGGKE
jgi:hypothetical protein